MSDEDKAGNWSVGDTTAVQYSPKAGFKRVILNQMRASPYDNGFGFSVQHREVHSGFTMAFETEAEAKEAEAAMRKIIARVIDIS